MKTVKQLSAFLIALLLCVAFPLAVLADPSTPLVIDGAGLLTESEIEEVSAYLETISDKYDADIAVLTVDGMSGKTIRDFSDDYFDENGYGRGTDRSGVLWVIDMESRESYLSTSGEGITAVTDYGRGLLAEKINPYLSEGDFRGAMMAYADTVDEYFMAERNGRPVDTYEDETPAERTTSPGAYAAGAGVSLAAGFGLSFAATGSMKRKLQSVRRQTSASGYTDAKGFELTQNTDRYLYHRVVAVPIPKNDNGPRGGGSSVHTSSGGQIHGGGSLGKF